MSARPGAERRTGTVLTFDAAAGYGQIEADGETWFFHCTAISDGSRTIREHTSVTFRLTSGHLGRWEAADIRST